MLEVNDLFSNYRHDNAERFERYRRIVAMRRSGASFQSCADQFGITKERVRQICLKWWSAERLRASRPRGAPVVAEAIREAAKGESPSFAKRLLRIADKIQRGER